MKTISITRSVAIIGASLALQFFAGSANAALREYWVAAEKVEWNYAPTSNNIIKPMMGLGLWGNTLTYEKYRYIEYSDASFSQKIEQPKWMGILGPQLRAVEGDTLKVHFINKADKPLSMHPHGVKYDKANEGADDKGKGAAVPPGDSFTYEWQVDHKAAPGPSDPSSIMWAYHSHVDSVTEIYDGLIGTIVVTKKGMERSESDPRPKDVDVDFTAMFMVFDENGRPAINSRSAESHSDKHHHEQREKLSAEDEEEGNLMHAINGYVFGNLQGLEAKQGQRVRWYLLGMGTEVDLHTAHWHGETVLENGRRTDVVALLPTEMKTVDMVAENVGEWLFHCHVTDHITAGMVTRWVVNP